LCNSSYDLFTQLLLTVLKMADPFYSGLLGILLGVTHVFDNAHVNTPEILWNMHAMSNMLSVAFPVDLACWLCNH